MTMHDRTRSPPPRDPYPGYDVTSKWNGVSWNDKTREVIAQRLRIAPEPRFFTAVEFATVRAIASRVTPQSPLRLIPVAALLDRKLLDGVSDGYRLAGMPRDGEAWRQGLKALDAESRNAHDRGFVDISDAGQDELLRLAEAGELRATEWGSMRCQDFFKHRLLRDIVLAYYAHPLAWSEIGWGGPASPRGYVRLDFNERDPWEAAEARPGEQAEAARINRHVR
jgi:gluconate 2-dehydrogenase subunit 3-like protein